MIYKKFIKNLLFCIDPEKAHSATLQTASFLQSIGFHNILLPLLAVEDKRLEVEVLGRVFKNPLGLAAGFDKNALAIHLLQSLGFGHIEYGGVTAIAQQGNARPRVFRLPKDGAVINRMGFPSEGLSTVFPRISKAYKNTFTPKSSCPLFANVAKTTAVPMDSAAEDFVTTFRRLYDCSDAFTIDVSCPNTGERAKLQSKEKIKEILLAVQQENTARKPLLVKLGPDLTKTEIEGIIEVCFESKIDGIIATNTTTSREGLTSSELLTQEMGGLSGDPLYQRSLKVVRDIYSSTSGKIPIVAVGGIRRSEQVIEMMRAGASLVQFYTSLVYEGPLLVRKLNKELLEYLDKNNVASIREIIGT